MHRISQVIINNFRSCQNITIALADFTPLVGHNNAGKSNIIRAIEWGIDSKTLQYSDFYDPTLPIEVEYIVEGIDENVLDRLNTHRNIIEPLVVDETIRLKASQTRPDCTKKDLRLDIWKSESKEWDNPRGIPAAIKKLFPDVIRIEAMVDVNSELSSNKTSTTIGKLIKAIMEPIIEEQGVKIKDALTEIENLFGVDGNKRAEALKDFDQKATKALSGFFPGFQARLHAPAPEIKDLFKGGKLVFSEAIGDESIWRNLESYGHGVCRAAQMAMIKLLSQVTGKQAVGKTLLLVDEPELYLHPQMIESLRLALRKLSAQNFQIVFSTHSPLMIGRNEVADTVMVGKSETTTSIRKTLKTCCNEIRGCENQVESLTLDLNNSSQFLFCSRVAFVEGKTEKIIFPELVEKVTSTSLMESGTALVALHGCDGLPNTRTVLRALEIEHRAIVDLDFAFKNWKQLQVWTNQDPLYQDCLKEMRKIALDHGYETKDNGTFKKGNGHSAEEAYHTFATSVQGTPLVAQIVEQFKHEGIWIWSRGSIEYHLGMPGKGGDAIRSYTARLLTEQAELVIDDLDGITQALNWVLGVN